MSMSDATFENSLSVDVLFFKSSTISYFSQPNSQSHVKKITHCILKQHFDTGESGVTCDPATLAASKTNYYSKPQQVAPYFIRLAAAKSLAMHCDW